MCAHGREDRVKEEGPPAKRKEKPRCLLAQLPGQRGRSSKRQPPHRVPTARASDALQVQTSQSEAGSTTAAAPAAAAVLLRAAK